MTYLLGLIFVAIVVVAFWVTTWLGGVIAIVVLGALLLYIVIARREDPSVGTIERGRRREPTGTVRSGSSDAETANQRQGQE